MPEFPHKRQTIRSRRKQRLADGKKGIPLNFLEQRPKNVPRGEVIYRNPKAVPVDPIVRGRGQRIPFSMKNVEWKA